MSALAKPDPYPQEAIMDDEIGLLKLRVAKFTPKLLRDQDAARLVLLNGGWSADVIRENLTAAIAYAVEVRREWLRARRARKKAEREADKAWIRQSAYPNGLSV
jgi:hypothetical protein